VEAAVTVCTCFRANALVSARIKPSCSCDNWNFVVARHNTTTKGRIIFWLLFVLAMFLENRPLRLVETTNTTLPGRPNDDDELRETYCFFLHRSVLEQHVIIIIFIFCYTKKKNQRSIFDSMTSKIKKKKIYIFELNIKGNYNVFGFRRRIYYVLIRLTNRMLHTEYEYFSRYVFSGFFRFYVVQTFNKHVFKRSVEKWCLLLF